MTTLTLSSIDAGGSIYGTSYDMAGNDGQNVTVLPAPILAAVNANRGIKMPYGNIYRAAGFMYDPDNLVTVPDSTSIEIQLERLRSFTPKYKELVRAGKVVMNPYKVDSILITRTPGVIPPESGGTTGYIGNTDDAELMAILGLPTVKHPRFSAKCLVYAGRLYSVTWRSVFKSGTPSFDSGDSISDELLTLLTNQPAFTGNVEALTTSVLAACNMRAVDALTALAEMPETVREVFHILKTIGSLLSDFKHHKERLVEDGARALQNIRRASSIRISSLEMVLVNTSGSSRRAARERARINRQIVNARRVLSRQLRGQSIRTVSAIASLWMTYRYSIMPNVYLIRDIGKALDRLDWTRVSEHSSVSQTDPISPLDGWTSSGTRLTRVTATCQISLTPGNSPLSELSRVASSNLLVTAWELVPLSFVADWAVNVGDWLSAMSPPSNQIDSGISVAERYSCLATYSNSTSGAVVTVVRNTYSRTVIPRSFSGSLTANVNLNWKRLLDSLALSWSMVIKPTLRRH